MLGTLDAAFVSEGAGNDQMRFITCGDPPILPFSIKDIPGAMSQRRPPPCYAGTTTPVLLPFCLSAYLHFFAISSLLASEYLCSISFCQAWF
jgi:hypothetical protein